MNTAHMHTSFSELSPAPSPLFVSEFFTCPLHEHRHAASSRPVRWELLPSLHPGSCPLSAEPCGRLCHPQRLSPGAMSGPGHREGTRLHCGLAVCGEETLILVTMLVPSVSTQRSKSVPEPRPGSRSATPALLPFSMLCGPRRYSYVHFMGTMHSHCWEYHRPCLQASETSVTGAHEHLADLRFKPWETLGHFYDSSAQRRASFYPLIGALVPQFQTC